MLHRGNRTRCNRLGLAFFSQHNSRENRPSCCGYSYFVPFYCCLLIFQGFMTPSQGPLEYFSVIQSYIIARFYICITLQGFKGISAFHVISHESLSRAIVRVLIQKSCALSWLCECQGQHLSR